MNDNHIRKIIHIDMDAFYASVEQLDNPELKGKALAVGGNKERGVVAAASYEARRFGVRSAMSSKLAALKCPELIFIKPRFDRYKEISQQIRAIFFDYTDLVEPLSLDEAFLDVTINKVGNPSATIIAQDIRRRIKEEVGLNASAGISYNKFLAKIASDLNKPNGQAVIHPSKAEAFLEKLPIEKFFGIGEKTAEKMKRFGIYNGLDLKQFSLQFLTKQFGKTGIHYYNIVRGIHMSEVKPNRIRKSLSAENTFDHDLKDRKNLLEALIKIVDELKLRIARTKVEGRTLTLKIKYNDFTVQTRSKSYDQTIRVEQLLEIVETLLDQAPVIFPVRLLGVGISNLNNPPNMPEENKQLKIEYKNF
ncbi:DNA polymerase IV [Anditalea andensis]|uniref:DNA polymerase IV n=1 Tax=Anditalea andensis TaxID=1048983 RepID=A0A074L239_9BACT|nr:DNA polymerase IV [Anditalea andensis]KEO74540.1 DNA polymerase IV [Anditalea andensis]